MKRRLICWYSLCLLCVELYVYTFNPFSVVKNQRIGWCYPLSILDISAVFDLYVRPWKLNLYLRFLLWNFLKHINWYYRAFVCLIEQFCPKKLCFSVHNIERVDKFSGHMWYGPKLTKIKIKLIESYYMCAVLKNCQRVGFMRMLQGAAKLRSPTLVS